MKFRKIIAVVLAVILTVTSLSFVVSARNTDVASSSSYWNQTRLEDIAKKAVNTNDLGCTYTKSKTTWKVWSPEATSVILKRYATGTDQESGAQVLGTTIMTKDSSTGIWSASLSMDCKDQYYTYLVTNGGVTNETQDPYSHALGANGNRSMVVDLDSTDPDGWENDKHVLFNNPAEAAPWEIHVRDFSIDLSSGVSDKYRGKYLAFTEGNTTVGKKGAVSSCVDYLVEHGINCVQLMPIADAAAIDETDSSNLDRNWGYDAKNFSVPDGSYSTNPFNGNTRITEFKMLVQALHDRGISVVMDVVYNHTFVLSGSSLSLTCPQYYYRMQDSQSYIDGTGLGNVLSSDKVMTRKLIQDSLCHWVNEYHIDGFRFDLMGCFDIPSLKAWRQAINKIDKRILMYGEPWSGGATGITNALSKTTISQLSNIDGTCVGGFHEGFSGGLKGDHQTASAKGFIEGSTTATAMTNAAKGTPTDLSSASMMQTVNYTDNHDNLCLFDKVMAANGKMSTGTDDKNLYTRNKDKVNVSPSDTVISQIRLGLALTMTSKGVPFTMAGAEMARTKYGDGNSYRTPDNMNAINWERAATYKDLSDYYKGLTQIRKAFKGFSNTSSSVSSSYSGGLLTTNITDNTAGYLNKLIVASNNTSAAKSVSCSGNWVVLSNGTKAGIDSLGTASGSCSVPAYSTVILADSTSYNSYKKPSYKTMNLTVEHYTRDSSSGSYTKASTQTAKYVDGATYRASKDLDILFDHNFDKFDSTSGATSGKATAGTNVTVKFYYTRFSKSNYLTINFLLSGTSEKVKSPMVYRLLDGAEFKMSAVLVDGYQLDTSKYPGGTVGKIDATKATTLNFYYIKLPNATTKVHYYCSNTSWGKQGPCCYAYYTDANGLIVEPNGPWTQPKKTKMEADSSQGTGWFVKDCKAATCRVMFYPYDKNIQGQEPGAGEDGYLVSDEAWIENKIITFNTTIVTSFIDMETGKKLKNDITEKKEKVTSSSTYTTSPDKSLGKYITPANANGFYQAAVINVVYLYTKDDPQPTTPTTPTSPTSPTIGPGGGIYGDTNLNSRIDVTDATYIQSKLAKLMTFTTEQEIAADVNADDKVTILDATIIQKYLAKMIVPEDNSRVGEKIPGGPTTPTSPTTSGHSFNEFVDKYNELQEEFNKYNPAEYAQQPEYIAASQTLTTYQPLTLNPSAPQSEINQGYEDCQTALDNLSKMQPPTQPTTTTTTPPGDTVYLSIEEFPDWGNDGAVFAAYFFDDMGSEYWQSMSMTSLYKYKATIPDSSYNHVIFVRLNPAGGGMSWDAKWNQTEDLDVNPGGTYYITGWGDMGYPSPGYWG